MQFRLQVQLTLQKIYCKDNEKVQNKKEDCDRNIFNELSRCVQEQESSMEEASQKEGDILSGNVDFVRSECSRQKLGNDDKKF